MFALFCKDAKNIACIWHTSYIVQHRWKTNIHTIIFAICHILFRLQLFINFHNTRLLPVCRFRPGWWHGSFFHAFLFLQSNISYYNWSAVGSYTPSEPTTISATMSSWSSLQQLFTQTGRNVLWGIFMSNVVRRTN